MSARDIAQRLGLPCPCCDLRGTMGAYVYGECVALSCASCGHAWMERAHLYLILRRAWQFHVECDSEGQEIGIADRDHRASVS